MGGGVGEGWAKGFRDRGTPGAAPPCAGQGQAASNLTVSCLCSPHLLVAELPKFGSRREWGRRQAGAVRGQGTAPCLAGWHFCCLEEGRGPTALSWKGRCSYLLTCTNYCVTDMQTELQISSSAREQLWCCLGDENRRTTGPLLRGLQFRLGGEYRVFRAGS